MSDAKSVADYALIGDLRSAALVGRNGSIDWFCAPRFDSDASLAALVGGEDNGFWRIAPLDRDAYVERRYRDATLVLETTFTAVAGRMRLIDFMPLGTSSRTIVRIIEGISGEVPCEMRLAPCMKYGLIPPWIRREGDAWTARVAPDALALRTSLPLDETAPQATANFTVRAGERAWCCLQAFAAYEAPPPLPSVERALADTTAWWETWSQGFRYEGEWRDAVLRSAITLKALAYEPAGSFVAAPTCSLPEKLGGSKNWDYRYCWLRDASFTIEALLRVGFTTEAERWRDWLLRVCVGRPDRLHIMYGLEGERLASEFSADWLPGFADSKPVHIKNGAHAQFQLGVFGTILVALEHAQRAGVAFTPEHWTLLEPILDHIEHVWQRPDNGIWEMRSGGRQYVASKLMAWAGVEGGIALAQRGGFATDVARWGALAGRIHAQLCSAGFDALRKTFTQYYGSQELDAATLLIPLVGFLAATDERFAGTVDAIERHLTERGYVYRYSADDIDEIDETNHELPAEGAFTMCGFWLVQAYALQGRKAEAVALFERLLATANDVGLLSEEYDVTHGLAIGNVPQAFSHAGLIDAACRLSDERARATQREPAGALR